MTTTTNLRIRKLSESASRRPIEPDRDVVGEIDDDHAVVAPELLSVAGLDLVLTDEQWKVLAREEVAAVTDAGIRFEALLLSGFGRELARAADLTDDRVTFVLHELGEETRHSRLFVRLLTQLRPTARNPFLRGVVSRVDNLMTTIVMGRPALFCVMVLAGEEIPDHFQAQASRHPATDEFFRRVNLYHRAEEARHLAYARLVLPELWEHAGWIDRFVIRWLAPFAIRAVFDSIIHPGVYETVGLDGWRTWRKVRRSPQRIQTRADAVSGVLRAVTDAGAFGPDRRVTRPWRRIVETPGVSSAEATRS